MNHVLNGDINADGEFGGWHMHPGNDPNKWPANRFISGTMTTNGDGSVTVNGTVGHMDDDYSPTPKNSVGHTFFPEGWGEGDIRAAGADLLANGNRKKNGSVVTGNHRGVNIMGYLEKGVLTTFFPTGG